MKKLGYIKEIESNQNILDLKCKNGIARLIFMNEGILRLRVAFKDEFNEESTFAIIKTCWTDEWDELLKGEREKIVPLTPEVEESKEEIVLRTKKMKVVVQKSNLALTIYDEAGKVIHKDLQELGYIKNKNNQITHYSKLEDEDNFYGFGEKTGELEKKGKRLRMSNYDTPAYDPITTDPMYKHIPFYIKLDTGTKIASGVFYNDSDEGIFDLGNERSGYFEKYTYYITNHDELDIYFLAGNKIKDVVRNYTWLTGTTAMPPLATLGNLASTMYFTELSKDVDKEILNYVDRLKELEIPCDGYFLSSGYSTGRDGKRYAFTWNSDKFSNPKSFIEEMERKGAPVVPNIKPALLTTHPNYDDFLKEGAFLQGEEGPYQGRFWGGDGSFIDFLKEDGRKKWMESMKTSLLDTGIKSIWNDNCEYELYDEAYYGKNSKDALGKRPIFPNVMAKVAMDNLMKNFPNNRPFVMNRAGFAGLQRYAQTWSGDNKSTWEDLKYNIPTMLGMGLSGVASQGSDIGGFEGPAPTPELFVRWVQHGIFQPRFTIHSQNTDNTVTTPWMYTNYTDKVRSALNLRYSLIPYFYSLFHEAHVVGSPIARPMIYEFQEDHKVAKESFDFMLGEGLLVSTILEEGEKTKSTYLPEGYRWYDYHTKDEYKGGIVNQRDVDIDTIPLYIREGAIIPTTSGISNLNNQEIKSQKLIVAPGKNTSFDIYEDDGKTNEYKDGNYLLTRVEMENKDKEISLKFNRSGVYETKIEDMEVEIILKEAAPLKVEVGEGSLRQVISRDDYNAEKECFYYDVETRCVNIKYKNKDGNYTVLLDFAPKDMTGILEV